MDPWEQQRVAPDGGACCLAAQILAKADMRIAALYDQELVSGEAELQLGAQLRRKFEQTQEAVLQVCACASQSRAQLAAVPPPDCPAAPAAAAHCIVHAGPTH